MKKTTIATLGLFVVLSTNLLQASMIQRDHCTTKVVTSKEKVNEIIKKAVQRAIEKTEDDNQACCRNALLCGCCCGCFSGYFAGMVTTVILLGKQKSNS